MFQWFQIFNLDEFLALELVSKVYPLFLTGIGQKDILVTAGNTVGMTYDETFLSLELNDKNPFEFNGHAAYIDDNNDVWLGVPVAD